MLYIFPSPATCLKGDIWVSHHVLTYGPPQCSAFFFLIKTNFYTSLIMKREFEIGCNATNTLPLSTDLNHICVFTFCLKYVFI